MLVVSLDRHEDGGSEAVYIGDEIRVCLTRISGNKVRIGIEAPRSMTIRRQPHLTAQGLVWIRHEEAGNVFGRLVDA